MSLPPKEGTVQSDGQIHLTQVATIPQMFKFLYIFLNASLIYLQLYTSVFTGLQK